MQHSDNGGQRCPKTDTGLTLAVHIMIVSLVPLILASVIILYQFQGFSTKIVRARLSEQANRHRQEIDAFFARGIDDITLMFSHNKVLQLTDSGLLNKWLQTFQAGRDAGFLALGLMDDKGQMISHAGVPLDNVQTDSSRENIASWFQAAMEHDTFVSDIFSGKKGQSFFILTARHQSRGRSWLMWAMMDAGGFVGKLNELVPDNNAQILVLNSRGEPQAQTAGQVCRLSEKNYISLFQKENRNPAGTAQAGIQWPNNPGNADPAVIVETQTPAGERCIAAAVFLNTGDWLLVLQTEAAHAFEIRDGIRMMVLATLSVAALVIVLAAFFISGRLVKRFDRKTVDELVVTNQIVEAGKLASIGELAAGIAHEINNPLAIMVEEAGWIQDLLSDGIDNTKNLAEFKRALQQILIQGERCRTITGKLLSFARENDSPVETVQLNACVCDAVDLLSQKLRYADIEVTVRLHPDLPAIRASVTEIQQVLINILQNAIWAMKKTGGHLQIVTSLENSHIFISITDSGPGIPAEKLQRVFDPFFTTKPVGEGTGLGLSICYGIIYKMGGRIDVESVAGKGTTFTIVLPVNQEAANS